MNMRGSGTILRPVSLMPGFCQYYSTGSWRETVKLFSTVCPLKGSDQRMFITFEESHSEGRQVAQHVGMRAG